MATNEELARRIDELEREMKREREELEPVLNLYNAGIIIGRLLVIVGGAIVGIGTLWQILSGHIK